MSEQSGRHAALERLAGLAARYPDIGATRAHPLPTDGREASLCLSIEHGAVRQWSALRRCAAAFLKRPWETLDPVVQAALLGGSAQLLLLDRIPDHAAVGETVEWAKGRGTPASGGLVNAVLRRIAGAREELLGACPPPEWSSRRNLLPRPDGRAWRLAGEPFALDPLTRVAGQCSLPKALLSRWWERLGAEEALRLAACTLTQPPTTVVDAPASPHLKPHNAVGFQVFAGPHEELGRILGSAPFARVQDPASAAAVASTVGLAPTVIVDMCAGRGTKTLQLAALHPDAEIIASDTDESRLADLRQRAERVPHGRIRAVSAPDLARWEGKADLVLLDVPCSNTAVLARRIEARHRFDELSLGSLVALQRTIAEAGLRLLSPHGALLWSTCSMEPEEGTAAAAALAAAAHGAIRAEGLTPPRGTPGDDPSAISTGASFSLIVR